MNNRQRIGQTPLEQSARRLIDSLPFVQPDDEGYQNIKRLAARQPAGMDYFIRQDGHTFNTVQAHSPMCATNRGGQVCDCTPSACVAKIDPPVLPTLAGRTADGTPYSNPKK